jgi:hypothetical protein
MSQVVTDEMIKALNTLRVSTKHRSVPDSLKDAINVLDNAGVFASIDEAIGYDVEAVQLRG